MAASRVACRSAAVWYVSPDMIPAISFTYRLVASSSLAAETPLDWTRARRKLHASLRFMRRLSSFCSSVKGVVGSSFIELELSMEDCESSWFRALGENMSSMAPTWLTLVDEPQFGLWVGCRVSISSNMGSGSGFELVRVVDLFFGVELGSVLVGVFGLLDLPGPFGFEGVSIILLRILVPRLGLWVAFVTALSLSFRAARVLFTDLVGPMWPVSSGGCSKVALGGSGVLMVLILFLLGAVYSFFALFLVRIPWE